MAAAYSVGQQIAIAALSVAIGFGALLFLFRFRSFGQALRETRAAHQAHKRPGAGWPRRE